MNTRKTLKLSDGKNPPRWMILVAYMLVPFYRVWMRCKLVGMLVRVHMARRECARLRRENIRLMRERGLL